MRLGSARLRAMWLVLPALLLVGAACGSTDKRPAKGAEAKTPEPTRAAAAATPAAGGGPAAPSGEKTVIVATDNKFDKTAMTIKAGAATTVELQNKGSAIHNWHVVGVKDSAGKEVITKLITGGATDTISFTIDKSGAFDYLCDVHPEMKGKLTVQ